MVDVTVFLVSALIIVAGSIGVIFSKNPVRSALSLVASFFGVAVLFVLLEAHFLALVQVVVYGGAIVVLFIFVIMLLGVDAAESINIEPISSNQIMGYLAGFGFLLVIFGGLFLSGPSGKDNAPDDAGFVALTGTAEQLPIDEDLSNVKVLARDLFSRNVLAFEATALLLTIATVGAVVMVKNKDDDDFGLGLKAEVDQ